MSDIKRIFPIGSSGVSTMAALTLEASDLAIVTAVLPSNYEVCLRMDSILNLSITVLTITGSRQRVNHTIHSLGS